METRSICCSEEAGKCDFDIRLNLAKPGLLTVWENDIPETH
jgi:hypothetical protein